MTEPLSKSSRGAGDLVAADAGGPRPTDFQLASRTPPSWAKAVARDLHALLSDHAHCELKAAASALTLLKRQSARPGLAQRVLPLIREEVEHAQRVLRELDARDWPLRVDGPSPYMSGLLAAGGAPRRRQDGYIDSLLVSAIIEQRSHERFERLLECEALAELAPLYRALAEAEARHGGLFVELACAVAPRESVASRHAALADAEATLIASLPCEPRIHSGPPRT
jgi:tRNA 2-(methylsulfanyl)-N6-isopentenyladenosine37 hydroxylase